MKFPLNEPISAAELAMVLELPHQGPNHVVTHIAALDQLAAGCLGFSTKIDAPIPGGSVIIGPGPLRGDEAVLHSQNPRLDFIHALRWLKQRGQLPETPAGEVHPKAAIHPSAIIELGATISEGCQIGPNCHIRRSVHLGRNVQVGSSSIIGHDGFGFERDEQGRVLRFPHLGRVIIQENVEIGHLCVIARGVLQNTRIQAEVKIDDQSYIAHNVVIGRGTLLMSGSRLNGSVRVGGNCWIGTGSVIREGLTIEDDVTIGMGSVVVKSVPGGKTAFGNPARVRD